MTKLQIILGSTRETRNADRVAPWVTRRAEAHGAFDVEVLDLRDWPPPAAEALELVGAYERLAATGLGYGPEFQGLTGLWRRGDELFAEVQLPEELAAQAAQAADREERTR